MAPPVGGNTVIYQMPDGNELELPAAMKPEQVQVAIRQAVDWHRSQTAQKAVEKAQAPPEESGLMKAYKSIADPVTKGVGAVINPLVHRITEPLVTATRIAQEGNLKPIMQESSPLGSARPLSNEIAKIAVPQTPAQLGMMALTPAARAIGPALGVARPLAAMIGGAIGGGGGAAVSGENVPLNAAMGAGGAALGEAVGGAAQMGRRSLPGAKAAINEAQATDVAGALANVSPAMQIAINNVRGQVEPTLRGGDTTATIKRALFGGEFQRQASRRMEDSITGINHLANNPTFTGPALDRAYDAMPALARDYLIGQVGQQGYTLQQAQAIRGWLGSTAFSQSPLGQGVGKAPQQLLWGSITQEIEGGLPQNVLPMWRRANSEYGGTQVTMEALEKAFQGMPNRVMLDRNVLSKYLSENQEAATQRLGSQQAYTELSRRLLSGAEPGTRDILAPGAGTATTALRQVYGRGQGGAPQIVGSALRTAAPNIGSEYTGQAPMQIPSAVRAGIDYAAQRGTEALPQETADKLTELLNPLQYLK